MNWEYFGWFAIVISGIIVLAGLAMGVKAPVISAENTTPQNVHPLHVWLEIAWPVLFIAIMGMLTLKEVMGFAAVLLLATVLTGVVWAIDRMILSKKRAATTGQPVFAEMAQSFFPVILIVFLLRSFLFEPFKIPSGSMVPTLLVGDFILVNKYTYGVRLPVINKKVMDVNLPKRGDVMVFRWPENLSKDFIKRVIGVPGDKISYRDKHLTVNGVPVSVEKTGTFTEQGDPRLFETYAEKLTDKPHSMMTDPNEPSLRLGSVREFPNRKNCEYNKDGLTCVVPPGNYFMMGDSRDNSDDSRYWGFVPEENIVGRAVMVWMNFSALRRIGTSIE